MAKSAPNDPFIEGLEARSFGIPRNKCPYPEDSDEGGAWHEGWDSNEELNEDGEIEVD